MQKTVFERQWCCLARPSIGSVVCMVNAYMRSIIRLYCVYSSIPCECECECSSATFLFVLHASGIISDFFKSVAVEAKYQYELYEPIKLRTGKHMLTAPHTQRAKNVSELQ